MSKEDDCKLRLVAFFNLSEYMYLNVLIATSNTDISVPESCDNSHLKFRSTLERI